MAQPERFELAVLPTPLHRAARLEQCLGAGPIWIKRDDLTGLGVAGNKARTLEFLIGDALGRGADTLVVAGSAHSNFCAAASLAARIAGLGCVALYSGAEPTPAPTTVRLAAAAGASQRFDPGLRREDLDAAVDRLAAKLRAGGHHPYAVPRGGATAVGALGFARAATELAHQCLDEGLASGTIVVPTGSGTTQAGLLAGQSAAAVPLRVVGASVSRPAEDIASRVLELARDCARLLERPGPDADDVDIRDFARTGFGVRTTVDDASVEIAMTTAGMLLDDTYGAKAMTLLRQLAGEECGPLIFWHTGGVSAALDAAADRIPAERCG